MPKKMTPEERREYQRVYRARKKLELMPKSDLPPSDGGSGRKESGEEFRARLPQFIGGKAVREPLTDRERGLPRSNYSTDWVTDRVIQKMSQERIDQILAKLPMTKRRSER